MSRRLPWIAITLVLVLIVLAIAAPYLPLENPLRMRVTQRMAGPSAAHWLGQDEFGRDVLSRLIWGARASLTVAFASALLAAIVGTALGILGGFLRGPAEWLTMRSMDVLLCFPPLLLALLAVAFVGPGVVTLIPVLAFIFVPGFTRVAYSGVISVRSHDYVEAARALGARPMRIMALTILPNIGGPVLVQFSLAVAAAIVLESGLSFLGLGVVPPTPSWGAMIGAARATMNQQPLLLAWPCLALTLTILIMNQICDGLRDMFDPHHATGLWRPGRTPVDGPHETIEEPAPLLAINHLTLSVLSAGSGIQPVRELSLRLEAGKTLAIVGESGSGKSLTGLAVMGLLPPAIHVTAGAIRLAGQPVLDLNETQLQALRGKTAAMIFQDPMSSLNPVHRVGEQIAEMILAHQAVTPEEARARAVKLLADVGIPDAEVRAKSYPHEMSGGMRQRVMIAMAIANDPVLLIADEPTTALDVTIQAQVLELLGEMKARRGVAMIFISHSLPVVAGIADRVLVMYAGETVEEGPADDIFRRPRHPYTAALIACAPDASGAPPKPIEGVVPSPAEIPPGCVFAPRCAMKIAQCEAERPDFAEVSPGHRARCHRWRET